MSGVISRGIKCPIFKKGDDLAEMIARSIITDSYTNGYKIQDKDIIAITESVVARVEGNYATIDDIAADVKKTYKTGKSIGIVFPILSRNRFSILLKGIARGTKKIIMQFSLPCDEVGNQMVNDLVDYYTNEFDRPTKYTEEEFLNTFGTPCHPFTGMNYIDLYKKIVTDEGCEFEAVFSNDASYILEFTKNVLVATTHTRDTLKTIIKHRNEKAKVFTMADIMSNPVGNSGYNAKYGILGSNKAADDSVKLFPTEEYCNKVISEVQRKIFNLTKKRVEVMVYGDGAFKDPVGKIWELADPVVSPAYTSGLEGTPNEIKLKYLADSVFSDLSGKALDEAIKNKIAHKDSNLKGTMITQGTTPRQYTDLLGSLSDLTSGSGDRGTPVVLIQNYFSNYAN